MVSLKKLTITALYSFIQIPLGHENFCYVGSINFTLIFVCQQMAKIGAPQRMMGSMGMTAA